MTAKCYEELYRSENMSDNNNQVTVDDLIKAANTYKEAKLQAEINIKASYAVYLHLAREAKYATVLETNSILGDNAVVEPKFE